ncbi:hypothetical protein KAI92_00045 [Candidatus Parcubacteria bacterium]|nr:hypothetical protein [Candidatus Parcubacteria bacterium]
MLNEKFDQELLGKIKDKKIIPRWHFLFKDCFVWFFGILSLIFGSLSFSVIFYLVKHNEWDVYSQIGESFSSFVFLVLPYFWILFLVFFMIIVYFNMKNTKKGYRYPLHVIVFMNIMVSMLFGVLFFYIGFGQAIDDALGERVPFYSEVINRRMNFWCQAEKGKLVGTVIEIKNENSFVLIDVCHKKEWIIEHDASVKIKIEKPIRLTGEMIADDIFKAEIILPAGRLGRGLFRKYNGRNFNNGKDCENIK